VWNEDVLGDNLLLALPFFYHFITRPLRESVFVIILTEPYCSSTLRNSFQPRFGQSAAETVEFGISRCDVFARFLLYFSL